MGRSRSRLRLRNIEASTMSDHGDHGHSHAAAPDNPAEHVDEPTTLYLVFALLLGGVVLTIACSMAGS